MTHRLVDTDQGPKWKIVSTAMNLSAKFHFNLSKSPILAAMFHRARRYKHFYWVLKNWPSASHTRAQRVPYLFLVFFVIAATIIHHP